MKFEDSTLQKEWEGDKEPLELGEDAGARASEAALGALLEGAGGVGADDDPERRVQRLGGQLARLDALNVAGMLAAATEGGGAELAARLERALGAAAGLHGRRARLHALAQPGAPDAAHARSGAARADANARALLRELAALFEWLDAPPLRALDALAELPLASAEGRARALEAAGALRGALRAEGAAPAHVRRLAAVRERLRRLARARDQLAAAVARHVNNLLIHLGNEAAAGGDAARHHAELLPLAPFMRWLKEMDEKAFSALMRVYTSGRARALEREARAACEGARAALAAPGPNPDRADELLDGVLALLESLCNAEQDFCTRFFFLDVDVKGDGSDGERSEGGAGGRSARAGAESRRCMQALLGGLEPALLALTHHVEKHEPYGAFRVMARVGRRVLGGGEQEARWARAALAGAAVAAKRGADRAVAERAAALAELARRGRGRPPPCVRELEALCAACERTFAGGRRADLDRWYGALAAAALAGARGADRRAQLETYHALGGALAALRVPALDAARRDCRARYAEALRAYVAAQLGRPLERLAAFFEGVAEAVAGGCPEEEVCYRAAYSKHELRRVLALYPPQEVRRALHRLYRAVEKHLGEDSPLLQVVWRAMQEDFMAQHRALEARIAACYPATGLALPLTTEDILAAFSDIAREH